MIMASSEVIMKLHDLASDYARAHTAAHNDHSLATGVACSEAYVALMYGFIDEIKQARIECAKVCRSLADLRGVNDHHKYMADKCAMEIEKLNEPSA